MKQDLNKLSKVVSHALRHEPWLYELELDDQGWVTIEALLSALREQKTEWNDLTQTDLVQMINTAGKQRHEIAGDRIRALYGHSLPGKLLKTRAEPPELLFHGTAPATVDPILESGLLPMGRQYVHLSKTVDMAKQVGGRKDRQPVILLIAAREAYEKGIYFYMGNDAVWLADKVPTEFIKVQSEN